MRISDPEMYQEIVDAEWSIIYDKLEKCVEVPQCLVAFYIHRVIDSMALLIGIGVAVALVRWTRKTTEAEDAPVPPFEIQQCYTSHSNNFGCDDRFIYVRRVRNGGVHVIRMVILSGLGGSNAKVTDAC